MNSDRKKELLEFCRILGEPVKNLDIFDTALTHTSYVNEKRSRDATEDNERIEFLGDSVLSLIVSTFLYKNFPAFTEGEMSKIRARYVCDQALADYAKRIDIGRYMRLGKGESMSGGRSRSSILACAFESIIGAIYMNFGFEKTATIVLRLISEDLLQHEYQIRIDYKTKLQEIVQQKAEFDIRYLVIEESGPDHDKLYKIAVNINGCKLGHGAGKSKKEAEQLAAKEAIAALAN